MGAKRVTKVALAERVRSLITGTQKHPPSGQVTLGGTTFTTQALVQVLQDMGNALAAVDTAKASWQGALKNLADVKAKVGPTVGAYRSWIVATYGDAPATLADFGLTPRKAPTPLTADERAAAVAKGKATRQARHTMGPNQKKAIKGTVTQATSPSDVKPAPAPATPSATPTPLPAPKPAS